MSNITNSSPVVTEDKLKDFYEDIKPFLGCPAYLTSEGTSDYYSTEEKVVGRWIDGKPVYQRTVKNTTLKSIPNNSWTDYCTVNNFNELISFSLGRITNNKVLDVMTDISGGFYKSNTLQVIARGASLSCEYGTITTFRYTKLTDSASTTIQEDPNEYSTDEKIIGKWIDGKPLYQKTFEGRTPSTLNTAENFCLFNNGEIFENIIIVDGFSTDEKSTPTYTSIQGGNGNSSWNVWANPTAIRNKFNDSTRLNNKAWITIRYTKKTD